MQWFSMATYVLLKVLARVTVRHHVGARLAVCTVHLKQNESSIFCFESLISGY